MATRVVPPQVLATLDPHAGRLGPRARRGVIAMCFTVIAVVAFAVWLVSTGHGLPRFESGNESARAYPSSHDVVLHININSDESTDVQVTGFTVRSAVFSIIEARPAHVTLRPGRVEQVRVRLHVRNCAAVGQSTVIPVAVVTDHWFGHFSRSLFSADGTEGVTNVAWQACHGG